MQRPIGLALGAAIGLAALTLAACQKAPAPPANEANATNAAPAAANIVAASMVAPPPPAGPAATATGPDADAAKAFLDGVYTRYKTNSTGSKWAPMDTNARDVFDPGLAKLLAADTKALSGHGVGDIDSDWLCDCQDWGALTAAVTVTSATPTEAKAVVTMKDSQVSDDGVQRRDTFDLVKTPAGWRIHDMGTRDEPSLRDVLTKEIAELKAEKSQPANQADGPPP
jgi:hypothetical protein